MMGIWLAVALAMLIAWRRPMWLVWCALGWGGMYVLLTAPMDEGLRLVIFVVFALFGTIGIIVEAARRHRAAAR